LLPVGTPGCVAVNVKLAVCLSVAAPAIDVAPKHASAQSTAPLPTASLVRLPISDPPRDDTE
jgi:hypothetical protein